MVRSSLAQILKVHGWKVITAESGEQALQHIEAKMEFVAMIIDYKMPNMTGLETLRKIRALGCQTPAILCSGYVPETMEAIIAKEFHGYLPKPYQISELQELLRRIVAE